MNRGDVVLLVLYCIAVVFGVFYWEIGGVGTAIVAVLFGGAVFAVRLWLARRTFRR